MQSVCWFGVINQLPHNIEVALILPGEFQNFQNAFGQFMPNGPPKHMITNANSLWKK